tara:strand:- start:262 stop:477 length:216 start_codon:yes stop_codon:yes gene_type:complete
MSVKNKIIEETIDTIIDSIDEKLVEYMFEHGGYEESNNIFMSDKEEMFVEVVSQLNKRIKDNKFWMVDNLN